MSDKPKEKSLIVPLQKGLSGETPYFMVSGLGGHVITFQIISKLVDNSLEGYGILYPSFFQESQDNQSIEAIAEKMLIDVKKTQPNGPYLFVGYSMGGLVCLEMARQLTDKGEKASIVMVDVKIHEHSKLKNIFRRLPVQIFWKTREIIDKIIGTNARKNLKHRQSILTKGGHQSDVFPESFDRVIKDGWKAVRSYEIRSCEVPCVLIRCKDLIWYDDIREWLSDYGWNKYVDLKGVLFSPGNHLTMLKVPNTKPFAEELEKSLKMLSQ